MGFAEDLASGLADIFAEGNEPASYQRGAVTRPVAVLLLLDESSVYTTHLVADTGFALLNVEDISFAFGGRPESGDEIIPHSDRRAIWTLTGEFSIRGSWIKAQARKNIRLLP